VANRDPRKLLGQRVRDLRLAKGLSQEKLAELAKLHRNYVGSIERGQKNVGVISIVKLAHALSERPSILLDTIP
jgi:transcriptional regulator with XRE-family HTH domain